MTIQDKVAISCGYNFITTVLMVDNYLQLIKKAL